MKKNKTVRIDQESFNVPNYSDSHTSDSDYSSDRDQAIKEPTEEYELESDKDQEMDSEGGKADSVSTVKNPDSNEKKQLHSKESKTGGKRKRHKSEKSIEGKPSSKNRRKRDKKSRSKRKKEYELKEMMAVNPHKRGGPDGDGGREPDEDAGSGAGGGLAGGEVAE